MMLENIFNIYPFNWTSMGTALLCGTMIGLERQLRGKPVGIRTSSMIILGTYVFVHMALSIKSGTLDPSRVIGQVITGVGFLGAGVMLVRNGSVVGVTSAATIWVLAGVGVIIAQGFLLTAIKVSLLIVFILYFVELLERRSKLFRRGVHRKYNLDPGAEKEN